MTYALYKTGSFSNYGSVVGQEGIYFSGTGSTLINHGSITGTSGNAVRLASGGEVRNVGYISGAFEGIRSDGSVYIFNSGTVTGTTFGVVTAGGTIFNSGNGFSTFGRISGGLDGVVSSSYATVGNGYGSIYGNRFGLNLQAGGTISNDYGGLSGGTTAVYVQAGPGYVNNAGNITGGIARSGDGVDLLASGRVTNTSHGSISTTGGRAIFSYAANASGFVTNYGNITANGGGSVGVYLQGNYNLNVAGGDVLNKAGGSIYGYVGVRITNGGYVLNAGAITGSGTDGVYIKGNGYVNNQSGGTITGANYGVKETGSYSRVVNAGSIHGQTAAQLNGYAGEVVNLAGGVINGSDAGVSLRDGGTVFNEKAGGHSGAISGVYYGVLAQGASAAVNNSGVIASFYTAVELLAGGSVVNGTGGLLNGYGGAPGRGVLIEGATGVVSNSGSINGAGYSAVELSLSSSGSVTNSSGGRITGALDGVQVYGAAVSVTNSGFISGGGNGIYLGAGGSVINGTPGTIAGGTGVFARLGATVTNFGKITGTTDGVVLAAGGRLGNTATGSISGASIGVLVSAGNATVTNAGKISGGSFAVQLAPGDTLIVDPGASFTGTVDGPSGKLDLAASASTGFISGFGSQFKGFTAVNVESGSKWTLGGVNKLAPSTSLNMSGLLNVAGSLTSSGPVVVANHGTLRTAGTGAIDLRGGLALNAGSTIADSSTGVFEIGSKGGAAKAVVTVDAGASLTGAGTVGSAVVDRGSIVAKNGGLAFLGSVSGTGTLSLSAHASVSVAGAASVSKLSFLAGGSETASFGVPTAVASTISGFTLASDLIDLKGFVATGLSFAGHTLTLTRSGGSAAHLHFAGSYNSSQFHIATDHHGGTNLRFV